MKRSRKLNRVSWAPGRSICQVKLFLSDDCPSQVGRKAQDILQAKSSGLFDWSSTVSTDFPPGFGGERCAKQSRNGVFRIPCIKWKCPPRCILNDDWRVAGGEESEERDTPKARNWGAFPPSLAEESYQQDESKIPIIPITPIEEETIDPLVDMPAPSKALFGSQPLATQKNGLRIPSDLEPDVIAAASAILAAVMESKEQGLPVDADLLIKILANPKMLNTLSNDPPVVENTPKSTVLPPVSSFSGGVGSLSQTSGLLSSSPAALSRPESNVPLPCIDGGKNFQSDNTLVSSLVKPSSPSVKDMSYIKSLIKQHGGATQKSPDDKKHYNFHEEHEPKLTKVKNQKLCVYFRSSKGCRNGFRCPYLHDQSDEFCGDLPLPSGKRMKLGREITGRS